MAGNLPDLDVPVLFLHIDDVAVPALGLPPVQRFVNQIKKAFVIPRILGIHGAAHRAGDKGIAVLQVHVLPQHLPVIDVYVVVLVRLIGQVPQIDDQHLVSAEAARQPEPVQTLCKVLRHLHQNRVPDMVAVGIVDKLEIVQVQHPVGKGNLMLNQPLGKPQDIPPGNQPGQRIQQGGNVRFFQLFRKIGIALQLFFGIHAFFLLRNVQHAF